MVTADREWLRGSPIGRLSRLRHADELVGFIVLLAIGVIIVAILEAGFLGRWFQPTTNLRILLPSSGVGGLVSGADVEVLGTRAGTIRRIVINPQRIYAEAEIDDQVRSVITRDSVAIIRRRFGVAGAAFVEIKRGSGPQMDWSFGVIDASAERAATDNLSALIDETREKIFPIMSDIGRLAHSLAEVAARIERGEGNIGRVVGDGALVREAEAMLVAGNSGMKRLDRVLAEVEEIAAATGGLMREAGDGKASIPSLLRYGNQILADVRNMTRDLKGVTTRAPTIARNVDESTGNLPAVLQQTQVTAQQLERLLAQLRGHWLLGGSGTAAEPVRLSPTQARP
jgi:phospholipid/cholesterol/gamma-HCH transport system substrate-binding protein